MIAARLRRHAAGLGFALAACGVAFAVLRHAFASQTLPPGVDTEYHLMYLQFLLEELLPLGRIRGWFPYTYNGFTGFLLYPPGFYLFGAALARLFQLSAPAALELAGAVCYALYPISCYAFLRLVGQRSITAWFGGATAFLVRTDFGLGLDGLVRQGAYANLFGIPLLVLYLGTLFATCRRLGEGEPSTRSAVAAGVLLALLFVSYIQSSIVASAATAFAFLGLLLLARPPRRPFWLLASKRFALIAGVALCLSSFFVVPFLHGLRERGPVTGWGTPDPAGLVRDLFAGRSLAPAVVVLFALAGIATSAFHAMRGSVVHFTLLLVGLLSVLLTFGWVPASGPLFPIVYPLESRALLYLAVLIPSFAAIAVAPFSRIRGWSRALPLLALLVFASVRVAGDERAMAETFSVRTSETLHALARELERHLPPGSRFFVEGEGAALRHPSYLHHYPFLTLAILSGRSTIQGDSMEQGLSGDNVQLVPEPEQAATPDGWRTLSSLGVTHVVTTTPAGAAALNRSGRFAELAEVDGNVLFRVNGSQGISTEPGTEARVRAAHRELLHLHVRSDSARSEVRVPITYSRRWHLSVDGEAAPISRGDHDLLSFVLASPGEHDVRIEYRNPGLDLASLLFSGASLAAVLAYLAFFGRRKTPS